MSRRTKISTKKTNNNINNLEQTKRHERIETIISVQEFKKLIILNVTSFVVNNKIYLSRLVSFSFFPLTN